MAVVLKPIGVARVQLPPPAGGEGPLAAKRPRYGGWRNVEAEIVVAKKYEKALRGLSSYSHVIVIYFMDRVRGYELVHRPQGIGPLVGVFACRCPGRPNHIGLSVGRLVSVRGNRVRLRGVDLLNGTPVLDLKPYTPQYDSRRARAPAWTRKLRY